MEETSSGTQDPTRVVMILKYYNLIDMRVLDSSSVLVNFEIKKR
jgi:hypothetical protein